MQLSGTATMGREHLATIATDGTFILTLLVHDAISIAMQTAWRLTWCGQEAADFYRAHAPALTPGALVHVEAERLWGFGNGRQMGTELHATVTRLTMPPRIYAKSAPSPYAASATSY